MRLIGANGEQLGVVPTSQAMEMVREANLDLVEVAAQERPPVCKILDYGKFRYQQSRKTDKKVHQQKLKEIRVRPKTGEHDVDTKINQARKFLEHKDKVLVNVPVPRPRAAAHRGRPVHHRRHPRKAGGRGQGGKAPVDGRQAHDGHAGAQGVNSGWWLVVGGWKKQETGASFPTTNHHPPTTWLDVFQPYPRRAAVPMILFCARPPGRGTIETQQRTVRPCRR